MRKAFSLLLAQLALAGVVTGRSQSAPSAQNSPPPLSLRIRLVKDVVQVGSPVDVEATIENVSDHFAAYVLWGEDESTKFDVRDAEGNQPLTRRGRALLLGEGLSADDIPSGSVVSKRIKPGETFTNNERVPGGIFDMTKPSTYTIQMRIPWGSDYMKSNVVTLTVVQGATPYVAPVQQPAISVSIRSASGASVFPGGQVAIEVITKNISNDWINERTAGDKRNLQRFFRVDVQDSQGGAPPETDFGRRVGNRGDTPYDPRSAHQDDMLGLHYDVGQERTHDITVSDLYDLSKPGQYTIQVRRWDDQTKTWVKSNTLTVTVTP